MKQELFFFGGTIRTMDPAVSGDAVLIRDGRILAVGSREELASQAANADQIDLKGNTLMPSFIDPHSHFSQTAHSFLQVSLDGVSTPAELADRIAQYRMQAQPAPGEWIIARDYDHNLLPGKQHPPLSVLDQAAGGNPLVIQHKSGHMGLMNSAALELFHITPETPVPEGGRIGIENGRLTGYLEENAFFFYLKQIPSPDPKKLLDAYEKAQQLYASNGITTIQEGMMVKEMIPMYQALLKQNLLRLDLVSYADPAAYDTVKEQLPTHIKSYDHHLRIGGLKIFLDGSPQGRTAWMRAPYTGGDYCGYGTMTDEEVCNAFAKAAQEDTQLLAHCNGDAAAAQFLRCLDKEESAYPRLAHLRPVLIHGQLMGQDQLPEAARLGAVVSFFIAHVYHWGDIHIENFGHPRADHISAAASALAAGIPFTFHQDTPVIQPDMWETIWCAVNRKTKSGVVLGADERISCLDALKAVTVNAAYQYGEESQKGSITPGKQADLMVVNRDPLSTPDDELKDISILRTYKDGALLYTNPTQDL